MLEHDYTVSETVQLEVVARRCLVIQQKNSAFTRREELLQGKNLAAKPERLPCEQAHFRERIEDDSNRICALDFSQHRVHRLLQLDFRGMKKRIAGFDFLRPICGKLEDVDSVESPAMRR